MYQIATVDKLIRLIMSQYPYWENNQIGNNLKQVGRLFCVEQLTKLSQPTILEVGAGFDTFFADNFCEKTNYWMIDEAGFYDREKFDAALDRRPHSHFVDGLMGNFSVELPNDYFDMVFSVSVLEHVSIPQVKDVCRDMLRVLKPGGISVHSIDVNKIDTITVGWIWYMAHRRSGFKIKTQPQLSWKMYDKPSNELLLENQMHVYQKYGRRENIWTDMKKLPSYTYGTILMIAEKPVKPTTQNWIGYQQIVQLRLAIRKIIMLLQS